MRCLYPFVGALFSNILVKSQVFRSNVFSKVLAITLVLFLFGSAAYAQTVSSGAGSGNWNDPLSWTPNVVPTNANTTSVTIINGHTITVTDSRSIDQLTVNGTLIVNNGFVLTIANATGSPDVSIGSLGVVTNNGTIAISNGVSVPANLCQVSVSGRLNNSGTITFGNSSSRLVFQASSIYDHTFTTTAGVIPNGTPQVSWNATSTCIVSGYTTNAIPPTGLGQTFGNFIWDTQNLDLNAGLGGGFVDLNGALINVQSDLTISSTGPFGDALFLTYSTGYSATAVNNLTVSGGIVALTGDAAINLNLSQNLTVGASGYLAANIDAFDASIDVNGNLQVDGTLDLSASTGNTNFFLAGNLGSTGSLLLSGGSADFSFDGTSQSLTNSVDFSTGAVNVVVGDGVAASVVNLGGNFLRSGGNFTVANESELVIGSAGFIESTGTFSLGTTSGSNSILRIASTHSGGALQTGTSNGNIRIGGARTYSSGSTIVYNGTSAQFMGNGHPSATGVKTEISNTSGVTLASNVAIGGNLELIDLASASNLSLSNRTLTFNGNFIPNDNFLNVTSSSSLVINGTGTFGTLATTGSTTINNFTLNRTSSGTVTLGSNLTVGGTLTQIIGDITLNGFTFTINGPYVKTNGSINADGSASFIVGGTGALPAAITFAGAQALNTLTVNRASTTFATSSSLTLTNLNLLSGTFDNTGTITMTNGGVLTRTEGSIINNTPTTNPTSDSYDIVYNIASDISSGSEIPSLANQLRHLTKTGGAQLNLAQNVTINGNLTLTNGVFNASTFGIDLKGNFVANSTSILTSSAFTFSGTTTISGGSAVRFGNVTVSGSLTPSSSIRIDGNLINNGTLNAGAATTTFGGTTTISGSSVSAFNNIIISGSLTAPSSVVMNVAGNFTNNGTFSHNNGSITFNGTSSILGSATTSLYNVTISGALTAPSTSLNIAGNWSTSGTFTHNSGKVVLNGTVSAQSITGTISVNDIDISNPTGVNNNGTMNLSGVMTLITTALFDADGSGSGILTVRSTSINAGGRIATLPTPGNFTGNVTVERFVNSPASWRYLSMPITNGNVGNWQAIFPVTGNFSNSSPNGANNVTDNTAPSIYYYDATTQAYVAVGAGGTTGSTSLSNLVGYSPYSYLSGNFTSSVRGTIRTGNATVPTATGFNLVPNPYPSPIDWDNITRTGFSSTMSIRTANNVFASYVAGGAATNAPFVGWTGEVATGQSFWVQSTGGTSLNLTEAAKTGNQFQFLRETTPQNLVRVILSSETQRDETVIWFPSGATNGFDDLFDAPKMRNGYFDPGPTKTKYLNIASYAGESEFAINGLASLNCNSEVKLRVTDLTTGTHTISFSELESLQLGYQVILVDRYKKTEKFVSNTLTYEFEVSDDPASQGDNRFELRFVLPGNVYINSQIPPALKTTDLCDKQIIPVVISAQAGVSYQLFAHDVPVSELASATTSGLITLTVAKDKLSVGANQLDLNIIESGSCQKSYMFKDAIKVENTIMATPKIEKDGIKLTTLPADGNMQWFLNGDPIEGVTGSSVWASVSGLYNVKVTKGLCTQSSENMEVTMSNGEIVAFPTPTQNLVYIVLPKEITPKLTAMTLYDSKGTMILDHNTNPDILKGDVKILDLSNERPGLYLLSIDAQKRYTIKIVKK